jgi:hypothetical protein
LQLCVHARSTLLFPQFLFPAQAKTLVLVALLAAASKKTTMAEACRPDQTIVYHADDWDLITCALHAKSQSSLRDGLSVFENRAAFRLGDKKHQDLD